MSAHSGYLGPVRPVYRPTIAPLAMPQPRDLGQSLLRQYRRNRGNPTQLLEALRAMRPAPKMDRDLWRYYTTLKKAESRRAELVDKRDEMLTIMQRKVDEKQAMARSEREEKMQTALQQTKRRVDVRLAEVTKRLVEWQQAEAKRKKDVVELVMRRKVEEVQGEQAAMRHEREERMKKDMEKVREDLRGLVID